MGDNWAEEKLSCKVELTATAHSKAKMDLSELSHAGPKWPGLCTTIAVIVEGHDLGQGGGGSEQQQ